MDLHALRNWFARASAHVPPRDVLHLALFGAPSGALRFAAHRLRGDAPDAPSAPGRDADFVDILAGPLRALAEHYFRWQVHGLEHVPPRGGAILVGSHNGGLVNTDSYLTCLAIYDRFGAEREVNALVHDWNFCDPVMRRITTKVGGMRASPAAARAALDAGNLVLVYPGSDLDVWRPWNARHTIELGRRRGFLRLALRAGVPIVPVVSTGTQEQFVVLTRGDGLARALGLRRALRTDVCPVVLAVPWGLTSGFLPYVPLPAQTTIAFGPPIAWPDLAPSAADDPALLSRCYDEVRARMQQTMDQIARGRRAFLGQPRA